MKRRGPANLGAKKITYTVVPAFKACSSPTGTHGSLLAGPSYQTTASSAESATLTTGAGASFKGVASLAIEVFCTDGATPPCSAAAGDQEDVKLTATSTDVRCKSSIGSNAALCPSANSAGGKDYAGQVQGNATIRITDHYNTAGAGAARRRRRVARPSSTCRSPSRGRARRLPATRRSEARAASTRRRTRSSRAPAAS